MKKKSIRILLVMILILNLTGCLTLKKDPIDTEKFISVAESQDMTVADVLKQYSKYNYILEATVAQHKEQKWQIEFYQLDSPEKAKEMFTSNQKILKNEEEIKTEMSKQAGNFGTYSLTGDKKYAYLSYIEDTFVYVHVDKKYKDSVQACVKKLGY